MEINEMKEKKTMTGLKARLNKKRKRKGKDKHKYSKIKNVVFV